MTQILRDEDICRIEENLVLLKSRFLELLNRIYEVHDNLKNEKAKEYLLNGVGRRLRVLERCVENIYSIFPLQREKLLNRNELNDIDINLHAFFINIFGLLDNMAWVVMHEKNGAKPIDKLDVGLYRKETKKYLGDDFKQYLNSKTMKKWHNEHLKDCRDALSHRIPLYVPPKNLKLDQREQEVAIELRKHEAIKNQDIALMNDLQKEADSIGEPAPCFGHSLSETDNKVVSLHAQVITDFVTVVGFQIKLIR